MQYLFLLGRDTKLSKLEIATYFLANNIAYSVFINTDKFLILDIKHPEKISFLKVQKDLSGVTRIVKIYYSSKQVDSKILDKLDVDYDKKLNYTISTIDVDKEIRSDIELLLKQKFKEERIKAIYKKPVSHSKKRSEKNYITNPDNFYSWKIDQTGFEFFAIFVNDIYYFGITVSCFNPKINKFKDTKRPKIKEKYNTSFRIAGIMINLLGAPKKSVIADPFCGTGTFLIEGLIKDYAVIGVDVDHDMIYCSKKNIEWAIKEFKIKNSSFKVLQGSSGKVKFRADNCVFEPYMGPFLKKIPSKEKSLKIVKELNEVYFDVFKNLYSNLNKHAKIVCILPEFKTFDNQTIRISQRSYLENGFRVYDVSKINPELDLINPISYSTPSGSRINRYIYILEKE